MNITITTNHEEETFVLGKSLAAFLKPKSSLLLDGDLAAGKTIFAKGIGAGLGIKEHIKSPTYTLLCIYRGRLPLYHFDAYNLNHMDDFYDLGFDEYLDGDGVVLIEWASVLALGFPGGYIHVSIVKSKTDENQRLITLHGSDQFHEEIIKEWQNHAHLSL